jgi:hypothetical protein
VSSDKETIDELLRLVRIWTDKAHGEVCLELLVGRLIDAYWDKALEHWLSLTEDRSKHPLILMLAIDAHLNKLNFEDKMGDLRRALEAQSEKEGLKLR